MTRNEYDGLTSLEILANAKSAAKNQVDLNEDSLTVALNRPDAPEAAVAFHGFDELPDCGREVYIPIEAQKATGKIQKIKYNGRSDMFNVNGWERERLNMDEYGFTGWRYPVGDLSE